MAVYLAGNLAATTSGAGDVVGPAVATDNAIVRFDATTGKLVQNSGVTISDSNVLVVPERIHAGGGADYGFGTLSLRQTGSFTEIVIGRTNNTFISLYDGATQRFRIIEGDGSVVLPAAGLGIWRASDSAVVMFINQGSSGGTLRLPNLPTSAVGLSAGDVWNDSGTLKIV